MGHTLLRQPRQEDLGGRGGRPSEPSLGASWETLPSEWDMALAIALTR